jgi:acetyl-CoA C-acetyltransferase
MTTVLPTTPVLIGAGQFTHRGSYENCPVPIEMCAIAARAAAKDAGLSQAALADLDFVGVVSFTIDTPGSVAQLPVPRADNPPEALAAALGAQSSRHVDSHTGGNTPQAMVNALCEDIAQGRHSLGLLAGAEFLGSLMKAVKSGRFDLLSGHAIPSHTKPERSGTDRAGASAYAEAHGLGFPVNVYPLFENAYRAHVGRTLDDHIKAVGGLFAPFTEVATANPYAWFPQKRTAAELITVTDSNRMVGYPYPKLLNSIIQVDQSAAVIVASYEKARALGVSEDNMVFLHGCADTVDLWDPLDRVNYHSSPAMDICGRETLAMAGCGIDQIDVFDLYSCFPIAVELACDGLGIAQNDPRGLTLTGGLPYFGGPGNNYSMHAIAEAMNRCRANRGSRALVTANGWYLTKHAMGIYSTSPVQGEWQRRAPSSYQSDIDRLTGRDSANRRFVANTPKGDLATLSNLESCEGVGRNGTVRHQEGRNIFMLD